MSAAEPKTAPGRVEQPGAGAFYLPWQIGGVRRLDGRTLMVEVEHETLVVMAERALAFAKGLLRDHEAKRPKHNIRGVGYDWQSRRQDLLSDIRRYEEHVTWLKNLTARRRS